MQGPAQQVCEKKKINVFNKEAQSSGDKMNKTATLPTFS